MNGETGARGVGERFESKEGVVIDVEGVETEELRRGSLGSIDISVLIGGEEEVKGV